MMKVRFTVWYNSGRFISEEMPVMDIRRARSLALESFSRTSDILLAQVSYSPPAWLATGPDWSSLVTILDGTAQENDSPIWVSTRANVAGYLTVQCPAVTCKAGINQSCRDLGRPYTGWAHPQRWQALRNAEGLKATAQRLEEKCRF